jgi:clan AA aspartic protease
MHMGEVREKITLVNLKDIFMSDDGLITQEKIRRMTVEAIVDTGAWLLIMGEETRKRLGLTVVKESVATLAGGTRQACKITEPVGIRWKDRDTECRAMVLPGKEEVLLGCIPLEGMDLMVDPVNQRLTGAHGDEQAYLVR